jgi:hypothetical protein
MVSPLLKILCHTQRRTTVSRTPLDELSACRRDLYLTTHTTHNKFEPRISADQQPQTHALDCAVTGTGSYVYTPPFTSKHSPCYTFFLNTQFKMERIPKIRIFSQRCVWDCLPFGTWYYIIGYSGPNVLRQVNGLQSLGDYYTMAPRHISEELNMLYICVHKVSFGVQKITSRVIDWCSVYCCSEVNVKDRGKWPINITSGTWLYPISFIRNAHSRPYVIFP